MTRKDEATKRAVAKYQKDRTKMKGVRFFPKDSDLLAWVEGKEEPFSGHVKRLLRAEMESEKEDNNAGIQD